MDYDRPAVLMTRLPTGLSTPRETHSTMTLAQAIRKIVEEPNPGLNRATASIRYEDRTLGYDEIVALHGQPDFPRR